MTTWTTTTDGTLMHCERQPYWETCDCEAEGCMTVVCSKCQTELRDCEEEA